MHTVTATQDGAGTSAAADMQAPSARAMRASRVATAPVTRRSRQVGAVDEVHTRARCVGQPGEPARQSRSPPSNGQGHQTVVIATPTVPTLPLQDGVLAHSNP